MKNKREEFSSLRLGSRKKLWGESWTFIADEMKFTERC